MFISPKRVVYVAKSFAAESGREVTLLWTKSIFVALVDALELTCPIWEVRVTAKFASFSKAAESSLRVSSCEGAPFTKLETSPST